MWQPWRATHHRGCTLVLVHPEIHWNTGNAGRTCLAVGATLHLIEPLGFSLDERQVKRAGLDYWEHVDLRVWPSWRNFASQLPALGDPYFFSTKAARHLWDAPLGAAKGVVLIFGRETGGLPADLHEEYRDRFLTMPIVSPRVRSLNLSTSVAIAAYEVLRNGEQTGHEISSTRQAQAESLHRHRDGRGNDVGTDLTPQLGNVHRLVVLRQRQEVLGERAVVGQDRPLAEEFLISAGPALNCPRRAAKVVKPISSSAAFDWGEACLLTNAASSSRSGRVDPTIRLPPCQSVVCGNTVTNVRMIILYSVSPALPIH